MKQDRPPGAYVLIARDAAKPQAGQSEEEGDDSGKLAAQWVIASDIALTTFQGSNGLAVFARSYASAKPLTLTSMPAWSAPRTSGWELLLAP